MVSRASSFKLRYGLKLFLSLLQNHIFQNAVTTIPIVGNFLSTFSNGLGVGFLVLLNILSLAFDVGGFIAQLFGFGIGSAGFIYRYRINTEREINLTFDIYWFVCYFRSLGGPSIIPLFVTGLVHSAFSGKAAALH